MPRSVSLCIPSSCIDAPSCTSLQQASHVAHQIARAAVFHQVDEIIIYDPHDVVETSNEKEEKSKKIVFNEEPASASSNNEPKIVESTILLATLLQYYVTPSYLRKITFPDTAVLHYAKKIPKIPGLPFMNHRKSRYLEGITVKHKIDKKTLQRFKKGSTKSKKQLALESTTNKVQVGDSDLIQLDTSQQRIPVGMRVTVDTEKNKIVSARSAYGSEYFGYTVRVVPQFGKVFTECPLSTDGYSYTVYVPCMEYMAPLNTPLPAAVKALSSVTPQSLLTKAKTTSSSPRYLLVYGKWNQVDQAVQHDSQDLEQLTDASPLFDARLAIKSCSRVEDAVLMSLARLDL